MDSWASRSSERSNLQFKVVQVELCTAHACYTAAVLMAEWSYSFNWLRPSESPKVCTHILINEMWTLHGMVRWHNCGHKCAQCQQNQHVLQGLPDKQRKKTVGTWKCLHAQKRTSSNQTTFVCNEMRFAQSRCRKDTLARLCRKKQIRRGGPFKVFFVKC